jgi:hypothetical protein
MDTLIASIVGIKVFGGQYIDNVSSLFYLRHVMIGHVCLPRTDTGSMRIRTIDNGQ